MTVLGPNTNAPASILRGAVILCAGEDRAEMLAAFAHQGFARPLRVHRYRCYAFMDFGEFTLIWTGIGTGCLEPLLVEILRGDLEDVQVRRIVLMGTAGLLPYARLETGRAYLVTQAYAAATALDAAHIRMPLRPALSVPVRAPTATSVSTDFYYGFTPALIEGSYAAATPGLVAAFRAHADLDAMVDMEVAQFYFLCEAMGGDRGLQYAAVKAPTNSVTDVAQQTATSRAALEVCAAAALDLLDISRPEAAAARRAERPTPDALAHLMEEVKLYWQIQIGVGAVLGFLATQATATRESDGVRSIVPLVAFLLLIIGAAFNLLGSYHIWLARPEPVREQASWSFVGFMGLVYLMISGFAGALSGYRVLDYLGERQLLGDALVALSARCPGWWCEGVVPDVVGFALGMIITWTAVRSIAASIASSQSGRDYLRRLPWWSFVWGRQFHVPREGRARAAAT
ncbi:MAG TPA: hypothetical protein VEL75_02760 [Candidatus Methylomirabilis sp.]|nr:hypothetical protein [Candidatus Methylomirabilis sp.]